jgi:hypothetical protein
MKEDSRFINIGDSLFSEQPPVCLNPYSKTTKNKNTVPISLKPKNYKNLPPTYSPIKKPPLGLK